MDPAKEFAAGLAKMFGAGVEKPPDASPRFVADVACAMCRDRYSEVVPLLQVKHTALIESDLPTTKVAVVTHVGPKSATRINLFKEGEFSRWPRGMVRSDAFPGLKPRKSRTRFAPFPATPPPNKTLLLECRSCFSRRPFRLATVMDQATARLKGARFARVLVYI